MYKIKPIGAVEMRTFSGALRIIQGNIYEKIIEVYILSNYKY